MKTPKIEMKFFLYLLAFFSLSLFIYGCNKSNDSRIPYVAVNIEKNINNNDLINIRSIGGWTYIPGGSMGIILYRKSQNEIKAYDRHSPHNVEANCRVFVDESAIFATDTCSQSNFSLSDGIPTSGPAKFPLEEYATSFDGTILRITN